MKVATATKDVLLMAKAKLGKALATKLKDFIDEMKDKYAMTPDQTKSAIRNYANEGYLPKDPKEFCQVMTSHLP